jgi:hypothetical protein
MPTHAMGSLDFTVSPDRTIISDATGGCIEADGDKAGDSVHVSPCTGDAKQQWNFLPVIGHGGLQNKFQLKDTNKCLDVNDAGALDGAPVELRECDDALTESFTFADIPTPNPAQRPASSFSMRQVYFR